MRSGKKMENAASTQQLRPQGTAQAELQAQIQRLCAAKIEWLDFLRPLASLVRLISLESTVPRLRRARFQATFGIKYGLAPRQAVWPPSPRRRRRDCVSPVPADRTSSSRPIEASGKTLASHLRALPARNSSLELPSSQKSKTNSLNSWWPSISSFSQVSDAFKNHAEAGQPVLPRTHSPQRGHRGARDLHQRCRDSR